MFLDEALQRDLRLRERRRPADPRSSFHRSPRVQERSPIFRRHDQRFRRGLPLWEALFGLWQLHDVAGGVLEGDYPWPALMGLPTEKPRRMGFGGLGTCEVFSRPEIGDGTYFSAVLTVPKVVVRFVPTPLTTVIMTTAMPAAIRPYSIAVAPDVSRRKLNKVFKAGSFNCWKRVDRK
jgi:hypothetical protein